MKKESPLDKLQNLLAGLLGKGEEIPGFTVTSAKFTIDGKEMSGDEEIRIENIENIKEMKVKYEWVIGDGELTSGAQASIEIPRIFQAARAMKGDLHLDGVTKGGGRFLAPMNWRKQQEIVLTLGYDFQEPCPGIC